MKFLVSIIIPCFNQAQYLDEALQSVLDQTYENWECIIVNDGSPDNTEAIAQKWVRKDSRFIYLYKKNGGVSSSRNLALEMVKGDYIQFLDSDDFLNKEKLELSLNLINEGHENDIKIIVSDFRRFINNPNKTLNPYCNLNSELLNFESLLYSWNATFSIPIHCGFFKASLFENIRFPENMTAHEDWIVWVSIFKTGSKALFLDKILALYRMNPSSRVMTKSLYEDQIKACEYFKHYLSEQEFYKLSMLLISRYYKSNDDLKCRLKATKNSNSYQTGLMIKKILKTFGVLKLSKSLFPIILKLKSK
ncbi:glycosyltransferase family 2 protein [Flavobacterium rhamnosiphilum]|uniref:Glycosyltransferase family 2 protein n=1 Tax=Flavobacterium rhamnosiphilum TaxID=2541724 RepID=A0A4R5FC64_9FLAO|nr:glycosyltransferase family 2 protein [Flavobacterium rhamnosiphilum]TDE46044.1 glycosyltransferase family 2 protein [Flavobacterium rhamnosiphilum]